MDISFNKMIEDSFKKNWDCPALSDYKGITLYYRDVARRIEKLHIIFSICGIQKGEKIALCARNQANWGVVFLACVTYGAVPVPILHEFKPGNIEFIVNHSDAKALFVGSLVAEEITASHMPNLENIINLDEFKILYAKDPKVPETREHLNELFGKKYPKAFVKESLNYYKEETPDELALINYTSGTSGFSKGVMIPYRALVSNVLFAMQEMPEVNNTTSVVSMLPTAHMYGMMFEFLFEMAVGSHVYFLTRVPSPSIIVKALEDIKPKLIIAVPLIIEKIYKSRLQPFLKKPGMRFLLGLPIVDKKIGDKINETLSNAFGGNFVEVIVGGAAFNKEADNFFHKIGFRYTVGYGMTECAPIIAYARWNKLKLYSCGKAAPRMQIKIDSAIPATIPGEILVKGDNVMLGYYKNEGATKESFTSDGWFRTGDLGLMDEDGYLYIKGRSKTMILGPSGQNIYPEEIESVINNMPYVVESLVVDEGGKLIALIYPDMEAGAVEGISREMMIQKMEENIKIVNQDLPNYCKLSGVRVMPEEFEKTPKRSIKRYLYQPNTLEN
jgi:long-chain acyl-CoA synthetase